MRTQSTYRLVVSPLPCRLLIPACLHTILYHLLFLHPYHSLTFETHVGLCPCILTFSLDNFVSSPTPPTVLDYHPLPSWVPYCFVLPSRTLAVSVALSCCATLLSSRHVSWLLHVYHVPGLLGGGWTWLVDGVLSVVCHH